MKTSCKRTGCFEDFRSQFQKNAAVHRLWSTYMVDLHFATITAMRASVEATQISKLWVLPAVRSRLDNVWQKKNVVLFCLNCMQVFVRVFYPDGSSTSIPSDKTVAK
mmetsp:Transcript_11184/g.21444  ORF Transcript_11184/g.21444 Transcript_11184/m.21444 type:complete len:107 (-) Transcript_11184:112-432(-)